MTSLKQQTKLEETAGVPKSDSSTFDHVPVSKATKQSFPVLGAIINFFSTIENFHPWKIIFLSLLSSTILQ